MRYLLNLRITICLFGVLCLLSCLIEAWPVKKINNLSFSKNTQTQSLEEKLEKVTLCQLKGDPITYNHKLVEVTGFISHGFEDFTIFEPTCSSWPGIWLEYGDTISSGTIYCCGESPNHSRPETLKIENIPIPLVNDEHFQEFDKLIQQRPSSVVHATVVGRFFSGEKIEAPGGTFWGGYGHMGCCSLLAIEQVITTDPHDDNELDYSLPADQPDIRKTGCGYKSLVGITPFEELIKTQQNAEIEDQNWIFSDPNQVASHFLTNTLNLDEKLVKEMKVTRKRQGRVVYKLLFKSAKKEYMVVVSRPYWLSFYAKDKKQVAWVVIGAYESSCGSDSSVILIHKGKKG